MSEVIEDNSLLPNVGEQNSDIPKGRQLNGKRVAGAVGVLVAIIAVTAGLFFFLGAQSLTGTTWYSVSSSGSEGWIRFDSRSQLTSSDGLTFSWSRDGDRIELISGVMTFDARITEIEGHKAIMVESQTYFESAEIAERVREIEAERAAAEAEAMRIAAEEEAERLRLEQEENDRREREEAERAEAEARAEAMELLQGNWIVLGQSTKASFIDGVFTYSHTAGGWFTANDLDITSTYRIRDVSVAAGIYRGTIYVDNADPNRPNRTSFRFEVTKNQVTGEETLVLDMTRFERPGTD